MDAVSIVNMICCCITNEEFDRIWQAKKED